MDGALALVVIVGMITLGVTVSSVMETLNPRPVKNLNKFDAIDEELTRLHSETEDYGTPPPRIYEEITRLNNALISEKENAS